MVGDVKQSIYKFRLARPELFLEKYDTYQESGDLCRIDLAKNFRSRVQVVDAVNDVFSRIMSQEIGGIAYDDKAALYPGATYPATEDPAYGSELLLIRKPEKGDGAEGGSGEQRPDGARGPVDYDNVRQLEALAIAARIKQLKGSLKVMEKATGELRPVRYSDMVILLRTTSGWDEEFKKVLEQQGIPVYITSKTGYFGALEVQELLQFLRVLDNPRQDIPLFGVMQSIFGGFTQEEIARIRSGSKGHSRKRMTLYEALKEVAQRGRMAEAGEEASAGESAGEETAGAGQYWQRALEAATVPEDMEAETELSQKADTFLQRIDHYRDLTPFTSIRDLLQRILDDYDYLNYVTALPAGSKRRANVEMLLTKASAFEKTSYFGLFHFIRYMEQLEKYDVDYGEADTLDENADVVRIMSIHKSKGLEFPVVFVSGLSKRFNMQDANQSLIVDMDLGVAVDYVDSGRRIKNKTLRRAVLSAKMKEDNLAEELRVLYVAMTRPKEKLIMTGMASKLESRVKQCAAHAGRQEELLSYQTLSSASGYLDWILPAFSRNRCFDRLYEQFGLAGNAENPLYAEKIPVTIRLVSPAGLVEGEVLHQMERAVNEQKIMEIPKQPPREEALKELVEERFSYQYPYEDEKQIPVKVTVSQLKKAGMEESEIGKELFVQEEFVPIVPGFMKKDNAEALTGADRGTAYHRLLECLDYRRAYSIKELMAQTEELVAEGKMTKEAAECIYFKSVLAFAKSPVGMRMRNAFLNGTLKREQPFVMSIPASEADPSYPADETILVQGIIDAWFTEGEKLVLVDYKTDRVKEAGELEKRYEKQLMYYQQARADDGEESKRENYLFTGAG